MRRRTAIRFGVLIAGLMFLVSQVRAVDELPDASPESVGMSGARLRAIDAIVAEGIERGMMPGCVVCVGRRGKIVLLKAYGNRQLLPEPVPMTVDSVFDLASLTKPVATATSIMQLVERGKLSLDDRVTTVFPEFGANGKDKITVRDLLLHRSGLIPDNSLADYTDGPEVAWKNICELKLMGPVGDEFRYSDVNFIVLGKIVEQLSGRQLGQFVREETFMPLGMRETGYLPGEALKLRAAPTEQRDGGWIRGTVHDPRAHALGGVAGHAGLFSTAGDLALFAQAMLDEGELRIDGREPVRVLSASSVRAIRAGERIGTSLRGLGWDKQSGYSSNRGDLLSRSAYGHGGYTGTVLWIDPELELFVVFLGNRLHPNGPVHNINPMAGRIVNVAAGAIRDSAKSVPVESLQVLTGIDVLERDGFRMLAGQRVGLITNQTGRNREGVSTVQLLHESPDVNLTTLFSPEHGFSGDLDVSKIGNTKDASTGLQIFSLYGETRRPTPLMLENVDTLVFDIQDVGTRFYTYISTMGEAMRAAAENKKRFVVLDRPNPIGGIEVSGPMLDAGRESFVGYHPIPLRHGRTVGELALMMRAELKLDLELEVVRCEGWRREMFWDQTGLTWINPSPNIRSLNQALLYPGVGLFEMTNVSVGRGTDSPFEILGAPWMDGSELAKRLTEQQIPGVVFVPVLFTPASSTFEGQECSGINLCVIDRARFDPVETGFAIAMTLRGLHPGQWEIQKFDRLLGNKRVFDSLVSGVDTEELANAIRSGTGDFRRRCQAFLLYE